MVALRGNRKDLQYADRDLEALAFALARVRVSQACVQGGASLGVFPLMLSRYFAEVHCFEPDPETYRLCRDNLGGMGTREVTRPNDNASMMVTRIAAPGRGEISVYRLALGERIGRAELVRRRRDGTLAGHTGVHHVNMNPEGQVRVITIDALELGQACGLIYLDVEGFEGEALRGGAKTIRLARPVIGVEINKALEARGIRADELVEDITRMGYRSAGSVHSDRIFVPREWGR